MKVIFVTVLVISAALLPKVCGDEGSLSELRSVLRESFGNLSSRRELWFDNYSALKRVIQTDEVQLKELLFVSKMAIPLIWHLYANEVAAQKATLPHLVEEDVDETRSLPFHVSIPIDCPPCFPSVHIEITMKLHSQENFQIELLKDNTQQIFFLSFDFNEKRAVFGNRDRELQYIERVVLAQDEFPVIPLDQPFRVNIQLMDDCVFAVLWLMNLDLAQPMPLPKKHHWCTMDYTPTNSCTLNILPEQQTAAAAAAQHSSEEDGESIEEEDEEGEEEESEVVQHVGHYGIKVIQAVVYGGLLIQ